MIHRVEPDQCPIKGGPLKVKTFLLAVLVFLFGSCLGSMSEYVGKLEPELAPSHDSYYDERYLAAGAELKLPLPLSAGEKAFIGELRWRPPSGSPIQAVLVEPAAGKPYLYADTNLDGTLSINERYPFSAVKDADLPIEAEREVLLRIRFSNGPYGSYPVLLLRPKVSWSSNAQRTLLESNGAVVRGTVIIEKHPTLVGYSYSPRKGSVDLRNGWLGMDCNGNGRIDSFESGVFSSPECAFAHDESVVFRVGTQYVSTKAVDLRSGSVILRSHPASEYQRIEVQVGTEVPDLSFTSFEGNPVKLSDFRGKYLLLDFWGSWCGACIAEFPNLKEAHEKLRSRGFEILGLDYEQIGNNPEWKEGIKRARKVVAEKGVTWMQASPESINDIVEKRFRCTGFPAKILLDPQGRILSWGDLRKNQLPIDGKGLMSTLEHLLSKPQ
jgi:thiol-disulfide isomerase/thioredoxin